MNKKCSSVQLTLETTSLMYSILHCVDCIMTFYLEPHTTVFHVNWTWTGLTCWADLFCPLGEQLFCVGLSHVVTREVSQSLDPGRLNSIPVKGAQVFAADTCLVGTFTARVVLFLIL